jgi:hypothetical protein
LGSLTPQFPRELRRGRSLGHPAQNLEQVARRAVGLLEGRAGPGVEHATAAGTLIIDDGLAPPTVNAETVAGLATGTG